MVGNGKVALKVAVRLLERLSESRRHPAVMLRARMEHVQPNVERLQALQRKITLCCERDFTAATRWLQEETAYVTESLITDLQTLATLAGRKAEALPSLRDLLRDLEQLEQEFGTWKYDARHKLLCVSIEPVTLRDIYLGPFEIHLNIGRLSASDPVRGIVVEALDPHPAGSDSGVTHPHVSSGKLCAGDASAAIANALQAGRICDVFIMVRSVLTTYNPSSPYVSLEEWDGIACYNCGYTTSEDNRHYCESCDRDFCGDCFSYCRDCDSSFCIGCLSACHICGDEYCEDCLSCCDRCGQRVCKDCSDGDLCQRCREEEEDEQEEANGEREEAAREVPAA
jgi:hypothetical protein